MNSQRRKNFKVVTALVGVIGVMTALVAYSPTLYRLFCALTGYGGTTQRAAAGAGAVSDRVMTVRFDTNVAPNLPWRFEPLQDEVKVNLGEVKIVFFSAENIADQPIVGHATFNVVPEATGLYFKKIQCFCFSEERLEGHQKVDMPVVFLVDPSLAADPDAREVNSITLSYTFFRSVASEKSKDLSRLNITAGPDAVRGQQLFMERCAACHALGTNKTGPMLGGVFGRRAGSSPEYDYSQALRQADLNWSVDNLDQWLSDPRKFIAETKMPVRVPDRSARRDIIAYLQKESRERSEQSAGTSVAQRSPVFH